MCGIIGYCGKKPAVPIVLEALKRLEYRGYDSAGIASLYDGRLIIKKDAGKIDEVIRKHNLSSLPGIVAIGHTRWATHGAVTQSNAHPHSDCDNRVAVVHNGIVENNQQLRQELTKMGHKFTSETDTEVIPHLLEDELKNGCSLEQAVLNIAPKLEGSYAFLVMSLADPGKIIGTRRNNPLIVGIDAHDYYISSDALAFSQYTNQVMGLEDVADLVAAQPGELTRVQKRDVPAADGLAVVSARSASGGAGAAAGGPIPPPPRASVAHAPAARRAGRGCQALEVGHQVEQLLHGHRVVVRGHLGGAVRRLVALALLDEPARVDDGFDEVVLLVERPHHRQLRADLARLGRRGELLAADLVAGVALELPQRLPATGGVALRQQELPARRRAMRGWLRHGHVGHGHVGRGGLLLGAYQEGRDEPEPGGQRGDDDGLLHSSSPSPGQAGHGGTIHVLRRAVRAEF